MRLGIPEIDEHAVAHVFRHEPTAPAHYLGNAFLIGRNDFAQVLRVHTGGECRRTDKVAEHDRDLAALGGVLGALVDYQRNIGWRRRWWASLSVQSGDGVEQLTAIPDKSNTKVLQVLRRQPRQDRVVDPIL